MSQFEQALDKSKLTTPMWLLWILSAGLIALDGFDFFSSSALLYLSSKKIFLLTPAQIGSVAVAAIFGSLIGSLTLGAITDKIGRQKKCY